MRTFLRTSFVSALLCPQRLANFLILQPLREKENVELAIDAFAVFKQEFVRAGNHEPLQSPRLVISGLHPYPTSSFLPHQRLPYPLSI